MQTFTEIITSTHFIWVGLDREYHEYLVDANQRVEGGIKHLVCRYPYFCKEWILRDVESQGYFSERPFKLGRGCDGAGDACCAALYYDFCQWHGLDPVELYRQAYQKHDGDRYADPDYSAVLQQANWEGVEYPQQWSEAELEGLIKSLYAINNRSLVQVLEEKSALSKLSKSKLLDAILG